MSAGHSHDSSPHTMNKGIQICFFFRGPLGFDSGRLMTPFRKTNDPPRSSQWWRIGAHISAICSTIFLPSFAAEPFGKSLLATLKSYEYSYIMYLDNFVLSEGSTNTVLSGVFRGQNDSGVPGQFLLMQKSQVILANPKVKNRKGA